jgi:hypothetical protein
VLQCKYPGFSPYSGDGIDVRFVSGGTTWTIDVALRNSEGAYRERDCVRKIKKIAVCSPKPIASAPMKMFLSILSTIFALMPWSIFAQHILACRGTDQVPIGSSAVFQMEEGTTYPIVGLSAYGNLTFATPLGTCRLPRQPLPSVGWRSIWKCRG